MTVERIEKKNTSKRESKRGEGQFFKGLLLTKKWSEILNGWKSHLHALMFLDRRKSSLVGWSIVSCECYQP